MVSFAGLGGVYSDYANAARVVFSQSPTPAAAPTSTLDFTLNSSQTTATALDADTRAVFKSLQAALNRFVKTSASDTTNLLTTKLVIDGVLGPATLRAAQAVVTGTKLNAGAQTSSIRQLATNARELAIVMNLKADQAGRSYTNVAEQKPLTTATETTTNAYQQVIAPLVDNTVNAFKQAMPSGTTAPTGISKDGMAALIKGGKTGKSGLLPSRAGAVTQEFSVEGDAIAAGLTAKKKSFFAKHWLPLGAGAIAAVGAIWYFTK